jgi:signal transduction histidine kinase
MQNKSIRPKQFDSIERYRLANDSTKLASELDKIRYNISKDDAENLAFYYFYKGCLSERNSKLWAKYADSALMAFEQNSDLQHQFPTAYITALNYKCDVLIYFKNYEQAFANYFIIKSILSKNDNPILLAEYLGRIANLYYQQNQFVNAARYHLESFNILNQANPIADNDIYKFHLTQAALNNAGFSYEKANMLDSADILYKKGLDYISSQEQEKIIPQKQINDSRLVFLDNLGGLMTKKGNWDLAKEYLEKSIAINGHNLDKAKSTAYMKLADVYIHFNELNRADSVLQLAEKVNFDYKGDKYKFDIHSTKARSKYYFGKKDYQQAYLYLEKYNRLIDSVADTEHELYAKDLTLRLENMQNIKDLKEVSLNNQYKTYFLIFTSLFIVMLLIAIFLFVRNMRHASKQKAAAIRRNEQLKEAFDKVDRLNKDYAKMMKIMAHDLKNPIGGMMGVANLLLEEENLSAETKDMLRLIANSGENSIEMINQLLNSRLAVENEEVAKEQIDIQNLIRECVALLQYKADEKHQKIVFVSGGPLISLIAREKIWRVFNNLIVNAIKFSPINSEIKVVLERQKKSARISVIDNGIGVPEESKNKIFEMFTSAKRSGTAGEQPFGLGLAISKQIIESHGGKIGLKNNPGGGTIFFVELPIS